MTYVVSTNSVAQPIILVGSDGEPYSAGGSGGLTDTQLRATPVPVSGTVTTGGLTDTQLRATAVPVSGTVTATGPLTDAQLRATAVPVSGTVTATGPLTDAQLRATAVPVSGTVTATGPQTNAEFLAALRSTAAFTSVNSANASTNILASNANRKGAVIVNTDANALYLDLSGGTAATTRYATSLATGDEYEVPFGVTGLITGIWAADGAGAALVTEFS